MQVKFLDGADRKRLLDTGAARNRRDIDPPGGSVRRRAADRLVALIVPDHDKQVLRLFVAKGRKNAEIKHHAAVGIERHDATVRQAGRQSEGLGRDAAKLLLEQTGAAHVRGGIVPFVDAGPQRQDHEFVF